MSPARSITRRPPMDRPAPSGHLYLPETGRAGRMIPLTLQSSAGAPFATSLAAELTHIPSFVVSLTTALRRGLALTARPSATTRIVRRFPMTSSGSSFSICAAVRLWWTPDARQAMDAAAGPRLFRRETPRSEVGYRNEVTGHRVAPGRRGYQSRPAQDRELRTASRARLGERFGRRPFHYLVLLDGSLRSRSSRRASMRGYARKCDTSSARNHVFSRERPYPDDVRCLGSCGRSCHSDPMSASGLCIASIRAEEIVR